MLTLHDVCDLARVPDSAVRDLIQQRWQQLADDGFDWQELGVFTVAEPQDRILELEQALHVGITTGQWCTVNFGEPGFIPCFELIEAHGDCFEVVYVLDDAGAGLTLWVPPDADPELLKFCRSYAQPALQP